MNRCDENIKFYNVKMVQKGLKQAIFGAVGYLQYKFSLGTNANCDQCGNEGWLLRVQPPLHIGQLEKK